MLPEQEYIGLLIAKVRRRLKQAVLAQVAPHGLTPLQFWLLLSIQANPGCSLTMLVERHGIDAPMASRVIAGLVRKKLVTLASDRLDRRWSHCTLTTAGGLLCKVLLPIAAQVRSTVVRGMSEREVQSMRRSLRKVVANLEALEQEGRQASLAPFRSRR